MRKLLSVAVMAGCLMTGGGTPPQDPAKPESNDPAKNPNGTDEEAEKAAAEAAKASGMGVSWFSRGNPFAPLVTTEKPKESDAEVLGPDERVPKAAAPEVAAVASATAAQAPVMPKLNGILCSGGLALAIVDDSICKVGDEVAGYRILSITPEGVLAEKEGKRYTMSTRQPQAQAVAAPVVPPPPAGPPAAAAGEKTELSGPAESADKPPAGASGGPAEGANPAPANPPVEGEAKL
ncbi:MAG: hypothetical protein IMZ66_07110 [Planctomycetes bacterium]|nr:hypothetical protein [Planctomycetota bacterium]